MRRISLRPLTRTPKGERLEVNVAPALFSFCVQSNDLISLQAFKRFILKQDFGDFVL